MKKVSENHKNINKPPHFNDKISYIKCVYNVKNYNEIQIINYKGKTASNEEIESKVKIWNGEKAEKLIFKKKFDKLGINVIYFIIEEKLSNMSFMFSKCTSLKEVNFVNVETIQVTKMRAIFYLCEELEYLDLTSFNISNVKDMGWMFDRCYKLKEIKGINKFNTSQVTNMKAMFRKCNELEFLDLSNFNTSNVIDMQLLFSKCIKLKVIKGINNFGTSNVEYMIGMFQECRELEYLDLSNFKTFKVDNMEYLFQNCNKLKEIKGINNFNTSNVISMKSMFQFLDLSSFDTTFVSDMGAMFNGCQRLKEIKGINNFNTINVNNMEIMFQSCEELEYLDLSNFDTSNVTNMNFIFKKCYKLRKINGINNFKL